MMNEAVFGRGAFLALVDGIDLAGGWETENADMPWLQLKVDGVYLVPPPPDVLVGITWPEIKKLYNLREDTPEAPVLVLGFPFSKDAFLAFMDRFSLDGDCNFVALEAISKKWHTIEKVAERLGIESADVFDLMKSGDIPPSVYLTEPVFASETHGDGSLVMIVGLFEVEGLRGLQWTGFKVLGSNLFRILVHHEELGVIDDSIGLHCREFLSVPASDPLNSKAIVDHSFLKSQIVVSDESLIDYTKGLKATIPGAHEFNLDNMVGVVPEKTNINKMKDMEDRLAAHAEAAQIANTEEGWEIQLDKYEYNNEFNANELEEIGQSVQEQSKEMKSSPGKALANIRNAPVNGARIASSEVVKRFIDEELRTTVESMKSKRKSAKLTICIIHFWRKAISSGDISKPPSYNTVRKEIVKEFKSGGRYSGYRYWRGNPNLCDPIKVEEE